MAPGQAARIEQGTEVLGGHVQTILPEIQNGTVKLYVALDRPNHPLLRNKMRVDVNIVTDQKRGVLLADDGPAFNGKGTQAVWIVSGGVARKSQLTIGAGDGKSIEILSGAAAGDKLVVSDPSAFKDHTTLILTYP